MGNRKRGAFSRRITAGYLGLVLLFSAVPVWGAEKPGDMDEETWIRLQDNVLEYGELENRVANFNPTILQIIKSINEGYDSVQDNIIN